MERCEIYFKSVLAHQNPAIKEPSCQRNNLTLLVNEVFFRALLIVCRSQKFLYRMSIAVADLYSGSLQRSYPSFLMEIRYLSAELFEIIGVVFCSILLLPFDRKRENRLIDAQIWIEKTSDYISGDMENFNALKDFLNNLDKKVQQVTLTEEETNQWDRINTNVNNRRIARSTYMDCRDEIYNFSDIITNRYNRINNKNNLPNSERDRALEALGLGPGASIQVITKAYRKLVLIHHPDRGGRTEDFQKIGAAYEHLTGK